MELQKSNTNFGMAYISPRTKDLKHFQKYMSSVTGKIDVRAMGDFVVQQAKNKHVDMQYRHTKNGDFFEIVSNLDPSKIVKVPCNNTKKEVSNNLIRRVKEWYKNFNSLKFEIENSTTSLKFMIKKLLISEIF